MFRPGSLFLFFLFLNCSVNLLAQEYNLGLYTADEGLESSEIYATVQDKKGNLWIGTYGGGLSRYNGISFKNYTTGEGLADNRILCVYIDSQENLWIGTYGGGVSCFDGATFKNYSSKEGLSNNIIYSICEDDKKNIWFATYGGGINIFDGKKFREMSAGENCCKNTWAVFKDHLGNMWVGSDEGLIKTDINNKTTRYDKEKGLKYGPIWAINEDHHGNIWLGTYGSGAIKFDGKTFTQYSDKNGLNNNIVYAISQDKKGNIWFGTDAGGVSIFNDTSFFSISEKNGLSHSRVRNLFCDREGNMWIGTDGGLNRYSGKKFTRYNKEDGLSDDKILSVIEDKSGDHWFGTFSGGLNRIKFSPNQESKILEVSNFTTDNGLKSNRVWKLFEDSKGTIWVGTTGGISLVKNGKVTQNFTMENGLPNNTIFAITEDRKGNIWIGSDFGVSIYDGKTFTNFSRKDGLSHNRVRSIIEDKQGNIWISTYAGGVNKFDGKKFIPFEDEKKLQNSTVYCMTVDFKGNIWFGTYGDGMIVYNPQATNKKFDYISKKEGLTNDAILFLNIDKDNILWVGTINGIDGLDLNTYYQSGKKIIKHYGKNEGLKKVECHQNAVYTDSRNNSWFGTVNGIIKHTPSADTSLEIYRDVIITGVQLFFGEKDIKAFSENTDKASGLPLHPELPYNNNHLTFEFAGIYLSNPGSVRYRYMIENLDKEWSPSTKLNKATYSNLPPGDYIFKVEAGSENNLWNIRSASFPFKINPPFWGSWWFYVLIIASGFLGIRLYLKIRTFKMKKDNLLLDRKVKEQTEELVRKNNEKELLLKEIHHRVKNNLQMVSSLLNLQSSTIHDEKILGAMREIKNRVNSMALIHQKLYQTENLSTVNFQDYIDQLVIFICHTFSFPENKVSVTINAKEIYFDVDTAIPLGLIINELISNSFKYAFNGSANGSINIDVIDKQNDCYKIIYKDNGPGLPAGLNIKESETLGLMLVWMLTEQLNGTVVTENKDGAEFIIDLKKSH